MSFVKRFGASYDDPVIAEKEAAQSGGCRGGPQLQRAESDPLAPEVMEVWRCRPPWGPLDYSIELSCIIGYPIASVSRPVFYQRRVDILSRRDDLGGGGCLIR